MGSLQYLNIYWESCCGGRGIRTWGLLGGHLLFVSHLLHLAEQRKKKKSQRKCQQWVQLTWRLRASGISNSFLQLHFAFRIINTSKHMIVPLIHGFRVFPWLWSLFFFFLQERTLHQAGMEWGWFVPLLKPLNNCVHEQFYTSHWGVQTPNIRCCYYLTF